jgi:4-hydroxy-tetrahydrodipicolinate reductase
MAKVIIVGLGPLGIKTVQFAAERASLEIVGAVDIAPALAGKDLGEHCGLPRMGVAIAPTMKAALGRKRADCAILTTVSSLAKLEPQVAEAAGMARGVEQIGRGFVGGREVIKLHFRAAVGEPRSFDRVEIKGRPDTVSEIAGGVHGDIATCAIVLNAVRSVVPAAPGLRTMLDVPAVTYSR